MTYDEWKEQVHQRIKAEAVWRFFGYRKALFLYNLVWQDCETLRSDARGRSIINQIGRSAGSISANIEEGHGRGYEGKEYIYFLRIALGSARETKGWYWRGRKLFSPAVLDHRLALMDEIISLLITELNRQKNYKKKPP